MYCLLVGRRCSPQGLPGVGEVDARGRPFKFDVTDYVGITSAGRVRAAASGWVGCPRTTSRCVRHSRFLAVRTCAWVAAGVLGMQRGQRRRCPHAEVANEAVSQASCCAAMCSSLRCSHQHYSHRWSLLQRAQPGCTRRPARHPLDVLCALGAGLVAGARGFVQRAGTCVSARVAMAGRRVSTL